MNNSVNISVNVTLNYIWNGAIHEFILPGWISSVGMIATGKTWRLFSVNSSEYNTLKTPKATRINKKHIFLKQIKHKKINQTA